MRLIVVGGQTKDIGKTTLVCNIIASFPQFSWTAIKLTTHVHEPTGCELIKHAEDASIWREIRAGHGSDTARFLQAGAKEAFLIEGSIVGFKSAYDALRQRGDHEGHIIVESTGAGQFLSPDLFLMLVESVPALFKQSALDQVEHADALLLRELNLESSTCPSVKQKPTFMAELRGLDQRLHSLISNLLKSSA